MRAVTFHITQYHLTVMSRMIKDLWLKDYWNFWDYDGVLG